MTELTPIEDREALARYVRGLSFEQAQAELEQVVELLEDQHTGLESALQLWERGEFLHAHCQSMLTRAEERMQRIELAPEEIHAVLAESGDDFVPGEQSSADNANPQAMF